MLIHQLHDWDLTPAQAIELQKRLAGQIYCTGKMDNPRLIAGTDVSVDRLNRARAAVVVMRYPGLEVVETACFEGQVKFPYVPGLLSFREIPLLAAAFQDLRRRPDLILVDGQGIAHPRRMGLASHLGLLLDIATIGCAKSHLYGEFSESDSAAGCFNPLVDNDNQVIGSVLRTKNNVKPLFISVGHKIDLPSSIHWVLQCCQGYRLPEPTRLAHQASRGNISITIRN